MFCGKDRLFPWCFLDQACAFLYPLVSGGKQRVLYFPNSSLEVRKATYLQMHL